MSQRPQSALDPFRESARLQARALAIRHSAPPRSDLRIGTFCRVLECERTDGRMRRKAPSLVRWTPYTNITRPRQCTPRKILFADYSTLPGLDLVYFPQQPYHTHAKNAPPIPSRRHPAFVFLFQERPATYVLDFFFYMDHRCRATAQLIPARPAFSVPACESH